MAARATGRLLFEIKRLFEDGAILEMRITGVPAPVVGSAHLLKYRLFYGQPGQRVVLYDNERGKGDHRHYGERQLSYTFVSVEELVQDFLNDVREARRPAPGRGDNE